MAIALGLVAACSGDDTAEPATSSDANTGGGTAGLSSSGGTGLGGGALGCPDGYRAWTVPGVREDPERDCVDVDPGAVDFFDVCQPQDDEKDHPFSFYYCLRRLSDGERYWINPFFWLVEPMPGEWEFCDEVPNLDELPPYPCFTDECEHSTGYPAPRSTCTEPVTRELYDCGGSESIWDAGCCRRPFCGPSGDCPDGLECREVQDTSPAGYCWVGISKDADPASVDLTDPAQSCACTGDFPGLAPRVCIEPR